MMKRTPPNTPVSNPIQQTSSDLANVTVRRKKEEKSNSQDQMNTFMAEMNKMFSEFKNQQESKFNSLVASVSHISTQNEEILKSIGFLSNKYDEIVDKIKSLEGSQVKHIEYINVLENKIELLQRNACSTKVEIRNVPRIQTETKTSLCEIVKKIGTKINCPIDVNDVRTIYRPKINKNSSQQSPIIVEFVTQNTKQELMKSTRTFNKIHQKDRLSTTHLDITGETKYIYIAEHLTPKTSYLFYKARQLVKDKNYTHTWTTNGQVYIRKKEGSSAVRINCEEDLNFLAKED